MEDKSAIKPTRLEAEIAPLTCNFTAFISKPQLNQGPTVQKYISF